MADAERNPGGRPRHDRAFRENSHTPRLVGWRAHRARVTVGELAYQLSVLPVGTDIWREFNVQLARRRNESPLYVRSLGIEDDRRTFEKYMKDLRDHFVRLTPKGNKFQRILRCEREVSSETLLDIQIVALPAYHAHNHLFWDVLAAQPSDYSMYWARANDTFLSMNRYYGCNPRAVGPHEFVRPSIELLMALRELESLEGLRLYMILFGAANNAGWPDIYAESFRRMIRIVCRLACLPPFAPFAQEFALDVIGSTLKHGRVPPDSGWKTKVTDRISKYQQLLQLAHDSRIVAPTEGFPTGDRDEMLQVLRFADEKGCTELHMAMTSNALGRTRKTPDLVATLLGRLLQLPDTSIY